MNLNQLLGELSERNINLYSEGERLKIKAPQGALTPKLRNLLAEHKEALLLLLQRNSNPRTTSISSIPVDEGNNLPLSIEQERLWAVAQLIPNGAVHNITQAVRLQGQLNIEVLQNSLNEIVRRHAALRTNFVVVDGSPVQTITSNLNITLELVEPKLEDSFNKIHFVREFVDRQAQKSFNLAEGALFDFQLVRLDESDFVLVLRMHHIIADGISFDLLIRELVALYKAYSQGEDSPLPELKIQYQDFAVWQRQYLQGEVLERGLSYWKQQLDGISPLKLPVDRPRPLVSSFRGGYQYFQLPARVWSSVEELSTRYKVTPFVTLLTAFDILLYRCCQQTDIVVGSPVSGRQPQTQSLIGFFAHPLLLRQDLSGNPSFAELLLKVRSVVLSAYDRQNIPLSKIIEAIKVKNGATKTQLLPVLFSFLGQNLGSVDLPQLKLTPIWETNKAPTDVDLFLTLFEVEGELRGVFEYNLDLFDAETITLLIDAYCSILERCLESPQTQLTQFSLVPQLEGKINPVDCRAIARQNLKSQIVITASFTAEPITDTLNFWLGELDLDWQIEFAPYNQIFQQLLAPESLLSQNQQGINVVLLRLEDWAEYTEDNLVSGSFREQIKQNTSKAIAALKTSAARTSIPYLLCLCPASPQILAIEEYATLLQQMERELIRELTDINGIYIVPTKELTDLYPVESYYDPHGDKLGRIPYTPGFFTALGTTIARKIHSLHQPTYKVLVLDCDRTLWEGICGEDGVEGITITWAYRALQKFAIAQKDRGMLLCLCSKNNLEDVLQVFEQNPHMLLNLEDLVSWRINWRSKSENLKSLAAKLQLGLDSFIFIDDNPVECAEVRANCSEVLTLQLPAEAELIPRFLEHVWAFDRLKVTQEDRDRASFYQQNAQRQQLSQQSLTLKDFIESLDLKVAITDMIGEEISRVAQLTQRTNQFNSTTIRRSASEIQSLSQSGELDFLTVKVRDRFGGYGLVGTVAFAVREQVLEVDALMLSCRVLGKGVEHQILAKLGEIALDARLNSVVINYKPTTKNQPILDFLYEVGGQYQEDGERGKRFILPSNYCQAIAYNPESIPFLEKKSPQQLETASIKAKSALIDRIANELYNVETIVEAVESSNNDSTSKDRSGDRNPYVPPATPTEEKLANLWSEVLHLGRVSVRDNFFQLGGNSLLAVQLMSRVREAFQVELPLSELLNAPTIENLGRSIEVHRRGTTAVKTAGLFIDLDAEVVLDSAIVPTGKDPQKPLNQASAIFLTGATGFLGAFLLQEFLLQTNAQIYCLVRSSSPEMGRKKIEQNLERYQIWQADFSSRIVAVVGDLSLPLLGLSESEFQKLSDRIDIIYHNGAFVNFTYPYTKLRAANVLGTQEVLRLAALTKVKPVHFISTVAVFDSTDYVNVEVAKETDSLPPGKTIYGGYAQSKWVAEKLVELARSRGLPVSIYRPGAITGHSKTGEWNTDDAICRILRGAIQLGKFPALDAWVEMVPVDYVARSIFHLSERSQSLGQIFHLVNPQIDSWNQIAQWIRAYGYPLEEISYQQWQQELVDLAVVSESNPLYPLLPIFFEQIFPGVTLFETLGNRPKFDCQQTRNYLAATSLVCPAIENLLETYLSYLRRCS